MLIYTQNNLLFLPQATVKRNRRERRNLCADTFYVACHQTRFRLIRSTV